MYVDPASELGQEILSFEDNYVGVFFEFRRDPAKVAADGWSAAEYMTHVKDFTRFLKF